jgi:hypothetical protein
MPPKKDKPTSVASSVASSTASSKRSVGRPRKAESEDPAIALKQQKARESAAKYRQKKKAMSMGNSAASSVNTAAGSTTLSGAPTGLAQNAFIIDRGSIAGVAKKLEQNEASSKIGKAIKNKLARTKVAELKYDRTMGSIKDGLFSIEIPYKDAKKYFSKDKRMMKYMMMNYGDYAKNIPPADEEGIPLQFRPYSNYDYFEFSYYDEANNKSNASSTANKNYNTKVPRSRDVDYSDYLYNNFITIGNNKDYEPSAGSGGIRHEGSSGAASSNKSMVGSISGDIGQVSSSSSSPVFKVKKARSVSSSPAPKKKGTNSSDSSDSVMTASMKRFRRDKAAGKYASTTSSKSEYTQGSDGSDGEMVRRRAKFSSFSSDSIGKGSSSSGSKIAGSRR